MIQYMSDLLQEEETFMSQPKGSLLSFLMLKEGG